jgi:hypothetical protein
MKRDITMQDITDITVAYIEEELLKTLRGDHYAYYLGTGRIPFRDEVKTQEKQ